MGHRAATLSIDLMWDPIAMRELFRSHAPIHHGSVLVEVVVERVRHRPGRRTIVQYTARFESEGPPRELWINGVAHPDRCAREQVRKLSRRIEIEPPDPMLGPVFHIPELNALFQVFPLDRRLPDLAMIGTDRGRRLLLELLGVDPGDATVFTPIRHRLGLSASVRVTDPDEDVVVKFHPTGEARPASAAAERVAARLSGRIQVVAPRLLARGHDITYTATVAGSPLDLLDDAALADAVPGVAADLAAFHGVAADGLADRDETPADRATRASVWLESVLPSARTLVREVWGAGETVGAERTLIHGDMKPEHIIISGAGRTFIDLDSAGSGRPLSDLASLAARLPDWAARELCFEYGAARRCDWGGWAADWALAGLKYALSHAQHRRAGWEGRAIDALDAALRPPGV